MNEKLSIAVNQSLLQQSRKSKYHGGQYTKLEAEQELLKGLRRTGKFMGVVPLQCKAGNYFYLTLADDHVAEHLFWLGCFGYERASAVLFTHLAKDAFGILDLGAYTGYYSVLAATISGNKNIVAVEANPLNFHRLTENLKLNGVQALALNNAIVPNADDSDIVDLFYDDSLPVLDTGSYVNHEKADLIPQKSGKTDFFRVSTIKIRDVASKFLDQLIELDGSRYILVKLDVEGLEAPLIIDLFRTFANIRIIVFVEILTKGAFAEIVQATESSGGDFLLAYIDEYAQTVCAYTSKELSRNQGSRNFVIAGQKDMEKMLGLSLNTLLRECE